jgi:hypothetical protein
MAPISRASDCLPHRGQLFAVFMAASFRVGWGVRFFRRRKTVIGATARDVGTI